MKVEVEFMGYLKSAAKAERLEYELAPSAPTVRHVIEEVAWGIEMPLDRFDWIAVLVDDELVGPSHPLREGDVVSLLPPVSGG